MPVRRFPPTGQDNAASAPWCRPKCPKRKPGITDFIGERPDAAHRPVFSQGASVFPAGAPLISSKYFLVERPRRRASRRLLVARSSQKAAQHAQFLQGASPWSPQIRLAPTCTRRGLFFDRKTRLFGQRFLLNTVCRCVSVPAPDWGLSNRVCRRQRRPRLPGRFPDRDYASRLNRSFCCALTASPASSASE
jgi:hypothetical protein